MRHLEPLVVDLLVVVHDDVEINGPRALVDQLFPSQRLFDILQLVQERQGFEIGLDLRTVSNLDIPIYTAPPAGNGDREVLTSHTPLMNLS